jgi:ABC-type uncharacterized transport system auxiliary subunit
MPRSSRPPRIAALATGCAAVVLLAACGGEQAASPDATASQVKHVDATPAATGQLASATWLISKEPVTLDLANDGASARA